jgi:hypothetical protein
VAGGRWSVFWGLVATPFLSGIGTNTSIADYAGQGTVFFGAAGILLFGRLPAIAMGSVAGVALTGLCLIQASRVSSSLLGMYRVGSVLDQTELLAVGPEAGCLRVDRGTFAQVESIHSVLAGCGFRAGTPVVGIDSLCGWVYLTGGSSPGVPWFFRDQQEYLRQVLTRVDAEVLESSWIWIRSSSQMGDPAIWWPPKARSVRDWAEAGKVKLVTDRGPEKMLLLAPPEP